MVPFSGLTFAFSTPSRSSGRRGFALPLLPSRYSALAVSLVLAVPAQAGDDGATRERAAT